MSNNNSCWQWSTNLTLTLQLALSTFVIAMGIKNILAIPVTVLNLNPSAQSCLNMPSYRHSLASVILSGIFVLAHLAVMSYPFRSSHFWITLCITLYSLLYSASLCVSGGIVLRPLVNSDLGYVGCQSEISDMSIIGATGTIFLVSILFWYLILVGRQKGYRNIHASPLYDSIFQTIAILKDSPGEPNAENTDYSSMNSNDGVQLYVGTKAELPTSTNQRAVVAVEAPIAVIEEQSGALWANGVQYEALRSEMSSSERTQDEMRYPAVELPGVMAAAELSSSIPPSELPSGISAVELSSSRSLNTNRWR